jgi:purine-binding chemotaxis protein CheW
MQQASKATVNAADSRQYLTFSLGGEMYAVDILHIKEIIDYGNLTKIPMTPPFIRGVINLRGAVVPVIDLSARFGGARTEVGLRTCIIIVELSENDQQRDIGVVVDAVSAVIEIHANDIEPVPDFGTHIRTDFIHGMGKVADDFVVILNVQCVLSVDEMTMLARLSHGLDGAAAGHPDGGERNT